MARRLPLALALLTALPLWAACSGEEVLPPSDAGEDAGLHPPDAEPPPHDAGEVVDAGVPMDGGPPPDTGVLWSEVSCGLCDEHCGPEQCLRNAAGESFCADRCDGDRDGCIDGFACIDISQGMGQFFCIPPGATCRSGASFGTSCFGGVESCGPRATHCEGEGLSLGYCTAPCVSSRDCPTGWICEPGSSGEHVCRTQQQTEAELCGRSGDPAEAPCVVDLDCEGGAVCVRSEPKLPGVCAQPCAGDAECGAGFCGQTARGPVCLTERCACHADGRPLGAPGRNLLDEALEAVGLTRCGLLFDLYTWAPNPRDITWDPYRLSFFDRIHREPLRAPPFAREQVRRLDVAAATDAPTRRAARLVTQLAATIDRPVVVADPALPDPVAPLATAVAALITASGGTPDHAALAADAADVPLDLQLAVAQVVDGIRRAHLARAAALPAVNVQNLYDYGPAFVARRADGFGLAPANVATQRLLNEGIDYGRLYGGAVDLLEAIAQADLERFARTPTQTGTATAALLFSQETPIGRIAIGDGESGIYDPRIEGHEGPWALLLDLGGDDRYAIGAGGNASPANSVSVLIDLGGDDRYGYVEAPHPLDGERLPSDEGGRYAPQQGPAMDNGPVSLSEVPRQGGARVGTAILVDLGGGDDHYQSLRMSQGAGFFGTGVLVDDGGDDLYLAEAASQGAASFGIGVLLDLGGRDVYRAYTMSQGFSFARAAGLLYDLAGDDQYLMDPGDPAVGGDPLYYSPQRPGRSNTTLGQGFSFGRRADQSDRAFMSGGVAFLIDAAGDDRYEGSIFAQGGGYWFGLGVLADHAGDDTYDALWYAMGTGAHYALGLLLEGGGNDLYGAALPRVNVTIAGGHDYSAAFLIDDGGNDVYHGSRITIGAGNLNGMGFLIDNGGDDQYLPANDYGLGAAGLLEAHEPGSPRRKVLTVGVFIDAGGRDTYAIGDTMPGHLGDDRAWLNARNMDEAVNRVELGSAVDGTGDSTLRAR